MDKTNRDILRLAVPSIVSNITVPLLGLCDVTIMGHVGGATHIGAIAVGSMIFNVMYWLFGFLRMGTSGLTAQAFGAGDEANTHRLLRSALTVGLLVGLAIVLLQWPLQQIAFLLMQPSADVSMLCRPYFYICVWGAPAVLGLYALTGWYIGMQDTRTPMAIAIGQNVLNIGLSIVLVVACSMGVEGVALGTCIAQWAGFLAAIALLPSNVRRRAVLFGRNETKTRGVLLPQSTLRVYVDIFLRTLCLVAVNLYFTSAGAAQGALILAANTLLMQFFMFFSYIMDGFAYAGEALAGRYYGAGDRPMLRRTVVRLFLWGTVTSIVFTIAYKIGGTVVLSLLTTDAAVVSTSVIYLPWAVFVPLAGMAAFVWDGVFIGTTMTRGMLISCFWASVAFFAICLTLPPLLGNHALWLALLVYLALRGLLQTLLFMRPYSCSRPNS